MIRLTGFDLSVITSLINNVSKGKSLGPVKRVMNRTC